jgi:threonine synthase
MLEESGGWSEAIAEAELIDTTRQLWRRGLYVEPTAALGAAAFRRAVRRGWEPLGPVVILLTGSGLKASSVIEQLLETS